MNIKGQIKILGDSFAGGYSNGISLRNSGTMDRFQVVSESERERVCKDDRGIILTVNKKQCEDVTEVTTVVKNDGTQTVTLEMITSFELDNLEIDKVHRMQTNWSAEGKLKSETITDLHLEKSWNGCATRIEKFGTVGSMPVRQYFPFVALENTKTSKYIAVQLYIPSSWQMELSIQNEDTYTLAGGIADRNFGQWTKTLKPGEEFVAPKAVIAEGASIYDVCDKLVKAQKPAISENDENMDVAFNEYCTTWGNPSFENVKKIADKIADKGIKFLVIDSGWYSQADNWWDSVGEWVINQDRFPGGMKPIADYIRSKGMVPGMWFEMESVTSQAKYFQDADLLVKKDGFPLTVGNRRFWDMENEVAVQYLTDSVIGILKEANMGYLKVDYNDTMGIGCDGPEGMGENLRRKVVASQSFFKKIAKEIPGIVIENCSSGGHRLEPSMMELVSQASFSDAHEINAIPLIAANLHRVIKPSQSQIWAVLRAEDSEDRIHYSIVSTMLGRMCLSGDIYNMSDQQWKIIEEGIAFYKKAAEVIRSGKTVLIDACADSYNQPIGAQLVVRKTKEQVLYIFHRFENSESLEKCLKRNQITIAKEDIIDSYGAAENDFSAITILAKCNN